MLVRSLADAATKLFHRGEQSLKRYTFQIRIGSTYSHAVELNCYDDADALMQGSLICGDIASWVSSEAVWVEIRDAKQKLLQRAFSHKIH